MPVYVTRAHVTIGDHKTKPASRRSVVPKHVFHISDICRTPYCFRTLVVSLFGFIVVAGGVIMTIIGYKPSILLHWYRPYNYTRGNSTNPSAVPRILGEPGPLRVLVYIGPTLMGIGFFTMMMAIVLFCEIKDRYFNNILPKTGSKKDIKDNLYDKIIEEFRKNYFRGIEVPLPKRVERRKSKGRHSFSLSGSGSLMSFGRRLSQDLQRRRRKSSKESQSERITTTKAKRSTLKRFLDRDSWMKTSSLPNIRQKGSFVELHNISDETDGKHSTKDMKSNSCGPMLGNLNISHEVNGVDNPAYKDSPPDKRDIPMLTKHKSLDINQTNKHITTVLVHRESNNEENISYRRRLRRQSAYEVSFKPESNASHDSVIDVDKDIVIDIDEPVTSILTPSNCDPKANTKRHETKYGTDNYCNIHTLGMDSGGSSMSLSWDNVPCEWNDARRNTEPFVIYQKYVNQNKDNTILNINEIVNYNRRYSTDTSTHNAHNIEQKQFQLDHANDLKEKQRDEGLTEEVEVKFHTVKPLVKRSKGLFRTGIGVVKSDSNLLRAGTYSTLANSNIDSFSLDSLELTDELLKNFEME